MAAIKSDVFLEALLKNGFTTDTSSKIYDWYKRNNIIEQHAEIQDGLITASVVLSHTSMTEMNRHEVANYIGDNLLAQISNRIKQSNKIEIIRKDFNAWNETVYEGKLHVFTTEELKQHDQDIIEEFCSRKD